MTRALIFAIGILVGILLTWLVCKRKTAQPVTPVTEDERWQKRLDSLDSFYTEEKANDRLGSKK